MRRVFLCGVVVGCAHPRTPEQQAIIRRGECREALRAADQARVEGQRRLAHDLAEACSRDKLHALADASTPAEALLWCGRASAAGGKGCDGAHVNEAIARLSAHYRVGPPDEATRPDPLLQAAFQQVGDELNLSWDAQDPDVIMGRLIVTVDHTTNPTVSLAPDANGVHQRIPAVQHRFVARAEAQVSLGDKTRTVHATEEARDTTWDEWPRLAVAARFQPQVPPAEELKRRAVLSWVRALAKALAVSPPEGVQVSDLKGCVAYGLALNLNSGNPRAASGGLGAPDKIAACEALLGEPAGAGIPVP